jgi:hypothetical protein
MNRENLAAMEQLTPVILFGAAAIAGHAYGEDLLERFGLRRQAMRLVERLSRWLGIR